MNALKLQQVTKGILARTKLNEKKAHRYALAALTGSPCPMCDDLGIIEHTTPEAIEMCVGESVGAAGGVLVEVCPVCVSVEEARQ